MSLTDASPGLSLRIRDLDILRSQLNETRPDSSFDLSGFDSWRQSIDVPMFPTNEEGAVVTEPVTEEAAATPSSPSSFA